MDEKKKDSATMTPIGQKPKPKPKVERLGPGVHAAAVELSANGRFRIRTMGGQRVEAKLQAGVDSALIEQCMRDRRPVLVVDGPRGALILGAIQTTREQSDSISLHAHTISMTADQELQLEVGDTRLVLAKDGVEIRSNNVRLDIGALVRILAARVELP